MPGSLKLNKYIYHKMPQLLTIPHPIKTIKLHRVFHNHDNKLICIVFIIVKVIFSSSIFQMLISGLTVYWPLTCVIHVHTVHIKDYMYMYVNIYFYDIIWSFHADTLSAQ